jgi:hypothetical protein
VADNDNNLRHLFAESPEKGIDLADVVRRSRARRLPRVAATGLVGVLAVMGVAYVGFQGLTTMSSASVGTESSAGSAPESADTFSDQAPDEIKRAPAEKINLCTGTLAEVAPSQTGLVLAVDFPDAAADSAQVTGTVTMTNTGSQDWNGYTAASPAITLSQGGIVLWHSNGPMIQLARDVALAPGESLVYDAAFTPVVCGVEDDTAESFRDDLPAAPAGEYQVSAAIDFNGELASELVTGPAQTVVLQ